MKKTLCALLALILILGAVGCGTGEKLPEQQTEPITVVETEKTSEPAATVKTRSGRKWRSRDKRAFKN